MSVDLTTSPAAMPDLPARYRKLAERLAAAGWTVEVNQHGHRADGRIVGVFASRHWYDGTLSFGCWVPTTGRASLLSAIRFPATGSMQKLRGAKALASWVTVLAS